MIYKKAYFVGINDFFVFFYEKSEIIKAVWSEKY